MQKQVTFSIILSDLYKSNRDFESKLVELLKTAPRSVQVIVEKPVYLDYDDGEIPS